MVGSFYLLRIKKLLSFLGLEADWHFHELWTQIQQSFKEANVIDFFPVVAHTPPPEASFPKITFSVVCNIHMPLRHYKVCPYYSYTGMQQGLDYSRSWHLLVRILLEISEQEQDFCYLRPRIKRVSSYCQTEAWWKNKNIINTNNKNFELWVKN